MKIAVTCVNDQVFQHFGHCPSFLVCEVENQHIISQKMLDTSEHGCSLLANFLKENGIDVVICGGIGGGAKNHIESCGMKLLPGASGNAIEQVENYLSGTLVYDENTECDHHDSHHHCQH